MGRQNAVRLERKDGALYFTAWEDGAVFGPSRLVGSFDAGCNFAVGVVIRLGLSAQPAAIYGGSNFGGLAGPACVWWWR